MTEKEFLDKQYCLGKYKKQIAELGFKDNPHDYPIVNHWNYKYVYKPNRFKIFEMFENAVEEYITISLENTEGWEKNNV